MKNLFFLVIVPIFMGCNVQYTAKKQAIIMTRAIVDKNYETALKYTHPNVVKLTGSNSKFIEVLKAGNHEMILMGNKYESIEIGKPSKLVKAGNELHCLVPETIRMLLKEGKMRNTSYLLAVSDDKGKNWTFIETALLTENNIYKLLPNYNKELVIPEKEIPKYFK